MTIVNNNPHSVSVASSNGRVLVKGRLHPVTLHKQLAYAMLESLRAEMRCQIHEIMQSQTPHTPIRAKEMELVPFIIACTRGQKAFDDALKMEMHTFTFSVEEKMHGTIELLFGEECTHDFVLEFVEWLCVELRHKVVAIGYTSI